MGSKDGQQWETGETARDWRDYRHHGDQGIWGGRMDDSGRLGVIMRD